MLRRGSSKKKKDKAEKPAKPKKEKAPKAKKEKPKKQPKAKKPKKPKKEGVVVAKQKNNIYTVLLLLSLVANVVAVLLLFLELNNYGGLGGWKP